MLMALWALGGTRQQCCKPIRCVEAGGCASVQPRLQACKTLWSVSGLSQELEVLVGIDLDPTAHALAKARLAAVERPGVTMHFMRGNYRCDGY
jgi:hypothetical protein